MGTPRVLKQRVPVKLKLDDLIEFEPLTDRQADAMHAFGKGNHVIMNGSAGTGKTFLALGMALESVLDKNTPYEHVIIVRSIVPTLNIGFLPGDEAEKCAVYEAPYISICNDLFKTSGAYNRLKEQDVVKFLSTSFVRGITLRNCIIIIDESENLTFHELDSVVTRLGRDAKLITCGDYYQSDLKTVSDKNGLYKFMEIADNLTKMVTVDFLPEDIVRSGFVRDYLMTKERLGIR